jgi:hypothetical protein
MSSSLYPQVENDGTTIEDRGMEEQRNRLRGRKNIDLGRGPLFKSEYVGKAPLRAPCI